MSRTQRCGSLAARAAQRPPDVLSMPPSGVAGRTQKWPEKLGGIFIIHLHLAFMSSRLAVVERL